MSDQKPPQQTQQCPVCSETKVHHERVYTIKGQRVVIRFAACLHEPPKK
jgi:C4-type Zn-finger protein